MPEERKSATASRISAALPSRADEVDVEQHGVHALVGLRLLELREQAGERVGLGAEEARGERVVVGVVGERAGDLQDEHAVVADVRLALAQRVEEQGHPEADDDDERHHDAEDDKNQFACAGHCHCIFTVKLKI